MELHSFSFSPKALEEPAPTQKKNIQAEHWNKETDKLAFELLSHIIQINYQK